MRPILQDSYEPLTEESIACFERELGFSFPSDYRNFLRMHNGGCFRHPGVVYVNPSNMNDYVDIRTLYGFHGDPRLLGDEARDSYETLRSNDPQLAGKYFPVAATGGGDWILLSLQDGSVFLLDHEVEDRTPRKVVASFSELIEGLRYDSDSDRIYSGEPLFEDVELGNVEALRTYLGSGGNVDGISRQGDSLLMCAVTSLQPKAIELLLSTGAKVHACDSEGRSPIWLAAYYGAIDIAKMLLSFGADLESRGPDEWTPLMAATARGNVRMVELLLEHGANVWLTDRWGETALDLCHSGYQWKEVRKSLERHIDLQG